MTMYCILLFAHYFINESKFDTMVRLIDPIVEL